MLLNPQGLVWIGRRFENRMKMAVANGGRCRRAASTRTRIRPPPHCANWKRKPPSAPPKIIAEAPEWYKYDLPEHLIGKSWKGKYRGQTQKWFALRFTGQDSEINLEPPGHKQEFEPGAGHRWPRCLG